MARTVAERWVCWFVWKEAWNFNVKTNSVTGQADTKSCHCHMQSALGTNKRGFCPENKMLFASKRSFCVLMCCVGATPYFGLSAFLATKSLIGTIDQYMSCMHIVMSRAARAGRPTILFILGQRFAQSVEYTYLVPGSSALKTGIERVSSLWRQMAE